MYEKIKFGYMLPYVSVKDSIEIGLRAEKLGYDTVWGSDHILSVFGRSVEDQFTLLAILARETRKVGLGMGVTDPHRRPPALLAQMVNTLDVISKGRVILGLGAGEAVSLTPFGINWSRPVSRLEEFLKILEMLWRGKFFDFEGEFFKHRQAILANRPVQTPHPPLWIGGQGPRMLEVTGRLAGGWLPYKLTPEQYRENLGQIRMLAKKAGRDPLKITPALFMSPGVARSSSEAFKKFSDDGRVTIAWSEDLGRYTFTPEHRELLLEKAKRVPEEEVRRFCIIGSPDDCIGKIDRFIKAGVEHLVLDPFWSTPKGARDQQTLIAKKILPYFKKRGRKNQSEQ